MNKRLLITIIIGLCSAIGILSHLSGLPDDETAVSASSPLIQTGAWVKYRIKRSQQAGAGFKTAWQSELKISIVEQEKKSGKTYYWVELAANKNTEQFRIIKFLITPEGEPIHKKLIIKHEGLNPVEIDLALWASKLNLTPQELFQSMTRYFMLIPFKPISSEGKPVSRGDPVARGDPEVSSRPVLWREETLQTRPRREDLKLTLGSKKETIPCLRYLSEDSERNITTKLWRSDKIPFPGVVKMFLFEESYQTKVILSGYGTQGAISLIKERPLPLKFRERK